MRTGKMSTRRLGTKVTVSRPEIVQAGDTVNDLVIGAGAFDAAGDPSPYNVNFLLLDGMEGGFPYWTALF
jgi:hypothetical protein